MKKILSFILIALLSFPILAQAEDPIVGLWYANIGNSETKERYVVIVSFEENGDIVLYEVDHVKDGLKPFMYGVVGKWTTRSTGNSYITDVQFQNIGEASAMIINGKLYACVLDASRYYAFRKLEPFDVVLDSQKRSSELVDDQKVETLNTGHFTISVPSEWIHVKNDNNGFYYYYAKKARSLEGGYLGIKEDRSNTKYASDTDFSIGYQLSSFAKGVLGEKEGIVEYTTINGLKAVTVRYASSETLYLNVVAVYYKGYLLTASYADESYDSEDAWKIAQGFFATIKVIE